MAAAPRSLAPLLLVLAISGCATLGPTSAQQSARTAWDRCPKTANLALTSIDPNGLVRYRAMSGPAGARELSECLTATGVPSVAGSSRRALKPLVAAAATSRMTSRITYNDGLFPGSSVGRAPDC